MSNPVLDAARTKRASHQTKLEAILLAPTADERSLDDAEQAAFEDRSAKIEKLDAQIVLLEAAEARVEASNAATAAITTETPGAIVRAEQMTYGQHNRSNSYLRDLAAIQVPESGFDTHGARERMAQHSREIEVEARTDATVAARWRDAGLEARVNPNVTAGTGGEFVPPLWLVNQYVPMFRPGRVFANRLRNQTLPGGIDVINIPRITTGSATAIQAANAAPVASTDIVTTYVAAPVNTIAGQEDISLQLLEQSPIAMDGVVFDDLTADYDQRLDLQVVSGTGSNGQHSGVVNISQSATPTISQAYTVSSTSATFFGTAAGNFISIVNAVNGIETKRYAPPTAIWVHPRRSNWWATQVDTVTGRPLFVSPNYGPYNVPGLGESSPVAQGVAGELFGLPVIKDANMNTSSTATVTTGGTQDVVVVLKEDDSILWEGQLKMRALPEVLSGTLQIRFQVYAYSALTFGRAPSGISIVSGAGLAAPTF
jgi:HK97 family phage major capsid protein